MATAGIGMEADESTDVEKHIHNLEFENQQYVKAIEKERTLFNALEAQITEYEAEITRLQQATSQLDEDTKLYHKQFLQNRDSIESLKTSVSISQHIDALKDQYQHVIRKGQLEKEEHETTLGHYRKIWADYETQYSKFPQAQVLNQAKQDLQRAQENLSVAIGRKHHIQETLNNRLSENGQSFSPYKTMNDLVVKLAEIKVSSMRKEEEIRTKNMECNEIKQEIEKRLQIAMRIKEETERKQKEEAERKHELELQRQREEEAQRKREEEARQLHEQAMRKQEEESQRKREAEAKRKQEEEAKRKREEEEVKRAQGASFSVPRLQMPPIIAQRGIKLPALQVPKRPSASMPRLNIPAMSPRVGAAMSPRVGAISRPAQASPPNAPSPKPQQAVVPSPVVPISAIRAPPTPSLSMPVSSTYCAPSPLVLSAPSRPPGPQHTPLVPTAPSLLHPSVPSVTRPTETSASDTMVEDAKAAAPSSTATTTSPQMSKGDSPKLPLTGTLPQSSPETQVPTTTTSSSPPPVKTPEHDVQGISAANDKSPGGQDDEAQQTPSTTPGRTPGRTPSSSTATTPKTPGSAFSIQKELARMRLLTAESPSSGFLYTRRETYEEMSPQSQWEEPPAGGEEGETGLSFFQTFQGPASSKGGGDELSSRGENKASPKSTVTTEPVKEMTTTPGRPQGAGDAGMGFMQGFNFNSPASSEPSGAGMGMFGSPKAQEESGFNFFKAPSAASDNHMNLFGDSPMASVGGFESSAPCTNVFSMFGGEDNTDDGDSGQGGFSFNFGGTGTNNSSTSGSAPPAAFSLF